MLITRVLQQQQRREILRTLVFLFSSLFEHAFWRSVSRGMAQGNSQGLKISFWYKAACLPQSDIYQTPNVDKKKIT
jgi:hypothetical protein